MRVANIGQQARAVGENRSITSAQSSRTISFSPLISVSMVSGDASAVLIRSLLSTIGVPLSRVSSIIAETPSRRVIGRRRERLKTN
jgi:hypothetical protein